jgi:hypothetical protein
MSEREATGGTDRQPGRRDREPAALALACGHTIKAAAAKAHVSERAIRYWLDDESFRERVRQLRVALYSKAAGKLAALSGLAVKALGGLLKSKTESVRLRAAVEVLSLGPQLREFTELSERVAALARRVNDGSGDTTTAGRAPGGGGAGPAAGGPPDPGPAPG